MRPHAVTIGLLLIIVGLTPSLGQEAPVSTRPPFDLTRLRPLIERNALTSRERLVMGLDFLKEELSRPSRAGWGMVGGPIDSGYIIQSIVGALAIPGSENPSELRQMREQADSPRVRELLAIPLAATGAQDMIPEVIRLAKSDREGAIRYQALIALSDFLTAPRNTDVPRRLRPGETYVPPSSTIMAQMHEALVGALRDPFARYKGSEIGNAPYYPIMDQAREALRRVGEIAYPIIEGQTLAGWRLTTTAGRELQTIRLNQPMPLPQEMLPHDGSRGPRGVGD